MTIDFRKLAQKHLEDAISKGYITLITGVIHDLKTSEILAVARYGLKEGLFTDTTTSVSTYELPTELLLPGTGDELTLDLDEN